MDQTPQCIVPAGDRCGEGVIWEEREQALYWTDINRFLIHRYDWATRSTRFWFFDEPVTTIGLTDRPGTFVVSLGSKLILWQPETDTRRDHGFVLPGTPAVRFNDGAVGPDGRLWIGSMRNNVLPTGEGSPAGGADGKLFRVDRHGEVAVMLEDLGIANTMVWSPDGGTFYTADTLADAVWAFDLAAGPGTLSNQRPFLVDFGRGHPDGSQIDAAGRLWNCRYGGGCIVRVAPDGAIDGIVEMPVTNITNCTFGGPDLKTLFITTAAGGPAERLAGGLYAAAVDVPGKPEYRFPLT